MPENHRIHLRILTEADIETIYALRSDPVVNRYLSREPARSIEDARSWWLRIKDGLNEKRNYNWAICLNGSGKMIGDVCLWNFNAERTEAEIGYQLLPSYHNKGYMTDACRQVLSTAKHDLKLKAVEAYTHRDNLASVALLRKLGMELVPGKTDPDFEHNVVYSVSLL